jgi:hypothetical protein
VTTLVCSAKGCRAPAVWGLRWNNPKLHTPERRKTWLACDEHREHLAHFLDARGFLRDTVAVDALDDDAPDPRGEQAGAAEREDGDTSDGDGRGATGA